jgi:hypothetical protein
MDVTAADTTAFDLDVDVVLAELLGFELRRLSACAWYASGTLLPLAWKILSTFSGP